MPITTGLNHVATLTTDMNSTVRFYEVAFGADVTFELPPSEGHPWMKVVDLGGGAAHFALAVASLEVLATLPARLATAGAQEIGEIQRVGDEWSLFVRDPDGMELEVCCRADG